MEKIDKYLPLGSVLLLKNAKHRVMVVGYCVRLEADSDAPFYDYMGCSFPEGIFTNEQSLAFNHSDIDKIYYLGYVDQEVKKFETKLKEVMKKNYNME